ncbi:hypothetical protein GDO81_022538 [Engystomops pustulosus]|uniref:Uncharacterized protein n=1 Tax=Engystomops pustulosus TaxID=76066 RepID=A0AAV6YM26_ENGPU|nr:hypothetical protein GDO81_022538 [Engystomops pustulosus]
MSISPVEPSFTWLHYPRQKSADVSCQTVCGSSVATPRRSTSHTMVPGFCKLLLAFYPTFLHSGVSYRSTHQEGRQSLPLALGD